MAGQSGLSRGASAKRRHVGALTLPETTAAARLARRASINFSSSAFAAARAVLISSTSFHRDKRPWAAERPLSVSAAVSMPRVCLSRSVTSASSCFELSNTSTIESSSCRTPSRFWVASFSSDCTSDSFCTA